MEPTPDQLYALLPLELRALDVGQGHPLRDLLRVIEEQVVLVEDVIAQRYDDTFIETCADQIVPLIAELIGYRAAVTNAGPSVMQDRAARVIPARREVAQALFYRRRRGAWAQLEHLTRDVTGWPVRAVEFHRLVATAYALNHPRPERGRSLNLRDSAALAHREGAFADASHTLELRSPASRDTPGRYGLNSVGLFVWRLGAYPVRQAPACYLGDGSHHYYTFSALGNDLPLFTRPAPRGQPVQGIIDLPVPISRLTFANHTADYYGIDKSLQIWLSDAEGRLVPVPVAAIVPADLSRWQEYRPAPGTVAVDPELGRITFSPSPNETYRHLDGVWVSYFYGFSADMGGGAYLRPTPTRPLVAISRFRDADLPDPLALARAIAHQNDLLVRYLWQLASDATRSLLEQAAHEHAAPNSNDPALREALVELLNRALEDPVLYELERFANVPLPAEARRLAERRLAGRSLIRMNRLLLEIAFPHLIARSYRRYWVGAPASVADDERTFSRLSDAITAWKSERPRHAEIMLNDDSVSRGYDKEEPLKITLAAHQSLTLRAAPQTRPTIRLVDYELHRPDYLAVHGATGSHFTLDGLVIAGQGVQISGDIAAVAVRHCTLVPGWSLHSDGSPLRPDGVSLELSNTSARLTIDHSIVGMIQVNQDEARSDPLPIIIRDSIVDATDAGREAIGAPTWPYAHAALTLLRSTVIGQIKTHSIILAENSLLGNVAVRERQHGCLRYCYVAPDSLTPDRYNCQPELAAERAEEELRIQHRPAQPTEAEVSAVRRNSAERVRLRFSSSRYGDPRYCRLSDHCAAEIRCGADDGSELGAFHSLYEPQRIERLRARLAEFIPAGVAAGVFFAD